MAFSFTGNSLCQQVVMRGTALYDMQFPCESAYNVYIHHYLSEAAA